MLLGVLLTFQIIVSVALIAVVLLQRSEGGALGMGGGPSGFMTARGAGDFLTRLTWILGSIFFVLSLTLTFIGSRERSGSSVVDRVKVDAIDPAALNQPPPAQPQTQPAQPAAPGPLQAPTPQLRNPFGETAPDAGQPASR